MYVATASPRPKRTAFDGSRGGECALCSPPLDPLLHRVTKLVDKQSLCGFFGVEIANAGSSDEESTALCLETLWGTIPTSKL